jgi:hypothetical protein
MIDILEAAGPGNTQDPWRYGIKYRNLSPGHNRRCDEIYRLMVWSRPTSRIGFHPVLPPAPTTNRMTSPLRHLGLLIRNRLPQPLRHALRLARHLRAHGRPSTAIPPALLADCRVCASRNELVKNLPSGGRIAEVGTYRGEFARHVLAACDPATLHLIDIDFSWLDPVVANDPRVSMHNGLSHETLAGFPDDHFDWIYIDGDHSYEGVSRDARVAATKVKPGGHLVFNDFAHADPYLGSYGVHRAVTEFAVNRGWKFIWWAYEPHGLYDVALRRPV